MSDMDRNRDYAFLHVPIPSALRYFFFLFLAHPLGTHWNFDQYYSALEHTHTYIESYRALFSVAPSPVTIKLTMCMDCDPP